MLGQHAYTDGVEDTTPAADGVAAETETTWVNMVQDQILLYDEEADTVFGDRKDVEKRCAATQKSLALRMP